MCCIFVSNSCPLACSKQDSRLSESLAEKWKIFWHCFSESHRLWIPKAFWDSLPRLSCLNERDRINDLVQYSAIWACPTNSSQVECSWCMDTNSMCKSDWKVRITMQESYENMIHPFPLSDYLASANVVVNSLLIQLLKSIPTPQPSLRNLSQWTKSTKKTLNWCQCMLILHDNFWISTISPISNPSSFNGGVPSSFLSCHQGTALCSDLEEVLRCPKNRSSRRSQSIWNVFAVPPWGFQRDWGVWGFLVWRRWR